MTKSAVYSLILLLTLCLPTWAKDPEKEETFNTQKLKEYLERMQVNYKKATEAEGAYVLIRREGLSNADRLITLIVNNSNTNQLEILTYPEIDGEFLNVSKLYNQQNERVFYEKLMHINHKSFGMFFVDQDGDVGLRFTFSTGNGVGFDALRAVIENCQRGADRFTPMLKNFMTTDIGY